MEILEIILETSIDVFIAVGSFVGASLLFFGYINYITHGGFLNGFKKHKHLQVVFGTLLGMTPGCGGAILVMPLYLKGHATFGTVVATLIATMGDAAFVLLATQPITFGKVIIISGIIAIISGYLIDYLKIGDKSFHNYTDVQLQQADAQFRPETTEFPEESLVLQKGISTDDGIAVAQSTTIHLPNVPKFLYAFRHNFAHYVFWIIIALSLPLGIMDILQIDYESVMPNISVVGAVGTFFSIIYTLICHKFIADDNLPAEHSKQLSLKETFVHNAEETAFVVMWVFVALFCYEMAVYFVGGEEVIEQFMQQTGYAVILIALLVGLIPGCGPQIILATIYLQGLLPFSALIANAICNDGDALFPLLAMDKKTSIWATILSLIPAWIIGTIFYMIGL